MLIQDHAFEVRGIELFAETVGGRDDPPLLLIGNSLLTWPDPLCARLVAGRRLVVRYDLRDTGRSTFRDPDAPDYALRDLVADAAALLDEIGLAPAHVAGFGPGGWIAQLLALDHPEHVTSLTLIAARPTSPGRADDDLPDHDPELMEHLMTAQDPDWSDRDAVVDFMVEGNRRFAGSGPYDEAAAREHLGRVFDRAASGAPEGADPGKVQRSNQMATAFAVMSSGDRWRERLGEIRAPTLVIHGADDPFFPVGNGEALAREIPGAELLVLDGVGQELPPRAWDEVAAALLRHTST